MTESSIFTGDLITTYFQKGMWKKIIELWDEDDTETDFYGKSFLWIRPSEETLLFIAQAVREENINEIVSIGCGTGLLEWLIQCATGLKVTGLEVDQNWWQSQYSPPKFISLVIIKEDEYLSVESNKALLFCYFNNYDVFYNYVTQYQGNCLVVIGPGKGRGTHTHPAPFDSNFEKLGWGLHSYKEIRNTKDYIAIYKRRNL